MVVAVGGGKALDAGKAVARSLHCHLITVPTAASNDAPTSKNYVLYDADHNLLAVEHMLFNPTIVLVDTTIIASAPAAFFRAGPATPCPRSSRPSSAAATADPYVWRQAAAGPQLLAEGCLRILLEDGAQALAAAGTGQPTPAFERAVEAMILLSGLGFESGGLSIAHALTRGLPRIAGLATSAHGLQAALGLLCSWTWKRATTACWPS